MSYVELVQNVVILIPRGEWVVIGGCHAVDISVSVLHPCPEWDLLAFWSPRVRLQRVRVVHSGHTSSHRSLAQRTVLVSLRHERWRRSSSDALDRHPERALVATLQGRRSCPPEQRRRGQWERRGRRRWGVKGRTEYQGRTDYMYSNEPHSRRTRGNTLASTVTNRSL